MTTVPEQFISDRPSGLYDWLHTLKSVIPKLPFSSAPLQPFPELGSCAPSSLGPITFPSSSSTTESNEKASQYTVGNSNERGGKPTLVAFLRHCGCPFAEKEVRLLATQARKYGDLKIVLVQHSDARDTRDWFERIGGKELFPSWTVYSGKDGEMEKENAHQLVIVPDPNRELYAKWGIGTLGWTEMVNGDIMNKMHEQKVKEGLDITKSDWTSYRWQNSGGFAIDSEGKIRWRKLAKDASDVCDWAEASDCIVKDMA